MDKKTEAGIYQVAIESIPTDCKSYKANKFPDNITTSFVCNTLLVLKTCHSLLVSDESGERCEEFLGAIHRAFLSDAFLGIEFIFENLARVLKLEVTALEKHRAEELKLEFEKTGYVLENKKLQKWLANKSKSKPVVMDIIHLVLDKLEIKGNEREEIIGAIEALKILRNKVSHGLPYMSDEEFVFIKSMNLPIGRDEQKMLTFQVILYIPIIQWLEGFFEKVFASSKIKVTQLSEAAS